MSKKIVIDFFKMLAENYDLQGEIADSIHLIYVDAGKKLGYDFTVQDVCEFMNKINAKGMLSDAELDNVTGGFSFSKFLDDLASGNGST